MREQQQQKTWCRWRDRSFFIASNNRSQSMSHYVLWHTLEHSLICTHWDTVSANQCVIRNELIQFVYIYSHRYDIVVTLFRFQKGFTLQWIDTRTRSIWPQIVCTCVCVSGFPSNPIACCYCYMLFHLLCSVFMFSANETQLITIWLKFDACSILPSIFVRKCRHEHTTHVFTLCDHTISFVIRFFSLSSTVEVTSVNALYPFDLLFLVFPSAQSALCGSVYIYVHCAIRNLAYRPFRCFCLISCLHFIDRYPIG